MPTKFNGISFEDNEVTIVEISRDKGGIRVDEFNHYQSEKFDPSRYKGEKIITSLSGRGSTFRVISLPFTQKKKILQILPGELEDTIPFPLDEVIFDYQIWEKDKKGVTLLVAIVKKKEFENFVSGVKGKDIIPWKIGVEPLYLSPLFQFVEEEKGAGIIYIGRDHSSLLLWGGGKKFFPRYLSVGYDRLVQLIMDKEGKKKEEAEKIRKILKSSSLLEDYLRLLSGEITQSIYAFKNSMGEDISKLYVTGKGSVTPDLPNILSQFLGIKCELLELSFFPPLPPSSFQQEFHLPFAFALNGIRSPERSEIDFSLPAEEGEKEWQELKPLVLTSSIIYFLLLLVIMVNSIVSSGSVKSKYIELKEIELKIINDTIPNVPVVYGYVETLSDKLQELKKQLPTTSRTQGVSDIDLLRQISQKIPSDVSVTITTISIDNERLRIKGQTDDFSTLDKVRSAFSAVKLIKNVNIVDSKKMQTTGKVTFTLIATVRSENGN